jgi:hypothetical protein
VSTYADRIDVLKNPMLCVGMPVSVVFDLSDGSQIALNEVDAREWCARNPNQFSRTAMRAAMETKQTEVKAATQVINLVAAAATGGFWLLDTQTGDRYIVSSPDYTEWQLRGGGPSGRYVPTTPSA